MLYTLTSAYNLPISTSKYHKQDLCNNPLHLKKTFFKADIKK